MQMIQYLEKRKKTSIYRIFSSIIVFVFSFSSLISPVGAQQMPALLNLPIPGNMVVLSAGYQPAVLRGLQINPENPLQFDFFIDQGESNLDDIAFRQEATKLVKYFLASLTVPEDELWVNLSPYEKDRVIPKNFGDTEMGRDLLAQDYMLKQLTASLMYPEDALGQKFWERVRTQAREKFGTDEIPMDTFNKIWIVPSNAVVYEKDGGAFVVESHLKVLLEEDYRAMIHYEGQSNEESIPVTTEVIREILIPEIEKEVNEGETFANLRQIYNSVILSTWYKQKLKNTLLGQVYADKNLTKGIDTDDKEVNQKIYEQYIKAFKTGVYNYIKEEYDPATGDVVPRKYFSGGTVLDTRKIIHYVVSENNLNGGQRNILERSRMMRTKFNFQEFGANATVDFDQIKKDLAAGKTAEKLKDQAMLSAEGREVLDWLQTTNGNDSIKMYREKIVANISRIEQFKNQLNRSQLSDRITYDGVFEKNEDKNLFTSIGGNQYSKQEIAAFRIALKEMEFYSDKAMLSEGEKTALTVTDEDFKQLVDQRNAGEVGFHKNVDMRKVVPASAEAVNLWENLSEAEVNRLKDVQREMYSQGKIAPIIMAGGEATRFGGPKTFVKVSDGLGDFLEVKAANLNWLKETFGATVPLYLLSSEKRIEEFKSQLQDRNYYGMSKDDFQWFVQGVVDTFIPTDEEIEANGSMKDKQKYKDMAAKLRELNPDGIYRYEGQERKVPAGHLDAVSSFIISGRMSDALNQGVEFVPVFNIDNLQAILKDDGVIAHFAESGNDFGFILAEKNMTYTIKNSLTGENGQKVLVRFRDKVISFDGINEFKNQAEKDGIRYEIDEVNKTLRIINANTSESIKSEVEVKPETGGTLVEYVDENGQKTGEVTMKEGFELQSDFDHANAPFFNTNTIIMKIESLLKFLNVTKVELAAMSFEERSQLVRDKLVKTIKPNFEFKKHVVPGSHPELGDVKKSEIDGVLQDVTEIPVSQVTRIMLQVAHIKDAKVGYYNMERSSIFAPVKEPEDLLIAATNNAESLKNVTIYKDQAMLSFVNPKLTAFFEKMQTTQKPVVSDVSLEAFIPELKGKAQGALGKGGLGYLTGETWGAYSGLEDFSTIGVMPLYSAYKEDGEARVDIDWNNEEGIERVMVKNDKGEDVALTLNVDFNHQNLKAEVYVVDRKGTPVFLIRNLEYFDSLYPGGDEQVKQYGFMGRAHAELLKALGVKPSIVRLSEPQMLFAGVAINNDRDYYRSINTGEQSVFENTQIVMTTHTPEAAALPFFDNVEHLKRIIGEDLVPNSIISTANNNQYINAADALAAMSNVINGVSLEHGDVTKHIILPSHDWKTTAIQNGSDPELWYSNELAVVVKEEGVENVTGKELFDIGQQQKEKLNTYLAENGYNQFEDTSRPMFGALRRIVEYKAQGMLIPLVYWITGDKDKEYDTPWGRKKGLASNLLIGGKGRDDVGRSWVSQFKQLEKLPGLKGKFVFVNETGVDVMRMATSASDFWMEIPRHTREASGTSGGRAALNGRKVIGTKTGEVIPLVQHGENGWVIDVFKGMNVKEVISGFEYRDQRIIDMFYQEGSKQLATFMEAASNEYYNYTENSDDKLLKGMESAFASAHATTNINKMVQEYGLMFQHVLDGTGAQGYEQERNTLIDAADKIFTNSILNASLDEQDQMVKNMKKREFLSFSRGAFSLGMKALKEERTKAIFEDRFSALTLSEIQDVLNSVNTEDGLAVIRKTIFQKMDKDLVLTDKETEKDFLTLVTNVMMRENIENPVDMAMLGDVTPFENTYLSVVKSLNISESLKSLLASVDFRKQLREKTRGDWSYTNSLELLTRFAQNVEKGAARDNVQMLESLINLELNDEENIPDYIYSLIEIEMAIAQKEGDKNINEKGWRNTATEQFVIDLVKANGGRRFNSFVEAAKDFLSIAIRLRFNLAEKRLYDIYELDQENVTNTISEQMELIELTGSEDKAMLVDNENVGGIDLNPILLDLQIIRDDNGIPLSIENQPIFDMNIQGFLPIIIEVTPVASLPMLLGMVDTKDEKETSDNMNPQDKLYVQNES